MNVVMEASNIPVRFSIAKMEYLVGPKYWSVHLTARSVLIGAQRNNPGVMSGIVNVPDVDGSFSPDEVFAKAVNRITCAGDWRPILSHGDDKPYTGTGGYGPWTGTAKV